MIRWLVHVPPHWTRSYHPDLRDLTSKFRVLACFMSFPCTTSSDVGLLSLVASLVISDHPPIHFEGIVSLQCTFCSVVDSKGYLPLYGLQSCIFSSVPSGQSHLVREFGHVEHARLPVDQPRPMPSYSLRSSKRLKSSHGHALTDSLIRSRGLRAVGESITCLPV